MTFERFHERVGHHPRCRVLFDPSHMVLQQLNYLEFIDIYKEVIGMFHVKDAEFNPTGRRYLRRLSILDRSRRPLPLAGRRPVDFNGIFSRLTQYGYSGWAALEWECCLKNPQDGAREGAAFIRDRIIRVTDKVFDDFAGAPVNPQQINALLGIR
ncbi:TIM barrel protein [Serratia ureilytica]